MTRVISVTPATGPLDAEVRLPGSKSITNRALVCAALATGRSVLSGALIADDTEAMMDCLGRLGIGVGHATDALVVDGRGRVLPGGPIELDARLSGTTARFLGPALALGTGPYRLDGRAGLRARPMGELSLALRALGVAVDGEGLPLTVSGGPAPGGDVSVGGSVSSQFLSGLLLAGPAYRNGLRIRVQGDVVSAPYVDLTRAVMSTFGADVDDGGDVLTVAPTGYRATEYTVESDASAATYVLAAGAICGGRVTVLGLGAASIQGDVAFADALRRMGVDVSVGPVSTTVVATGRLRGGEFDLRDLSDTAQTLAAVAPFAESPTRVTGIGFIRAKETDRIRAVVTELRRCGVDADEEPDGFVVRPSPVRPARVETYGDHRMAMSFALLGLRAPGIEIVDADVVAKTFPGYWAMLDQLRASAR